MNGCLLAVEFRCNIHCRILFNYPSAPSSGSNMLKYHTPSQYWQASCSNTTHPHNIHTLTILTSIMPKYHTPSQYWQASCSNTTHPHNIDKHHAQIPHILTILTSIITETQYEPSQFTTNITHTSCTITIINNYHHTHLMYHNNY